MTVDRRLAGLNARTLAEHGLYQELRHSTDPDDQREADNARMERDRLIHQAVVVLMEHGQPGGARSQHDADCWLGMDHAEVRRRAAVGRECIRLPSCGWPPAAAPQRQADTAVGRVLDTFETLDAAEDAADEAGEGAR